MSKENNPLLSDEFLDQLVKEINLLNSPIHEQNEDQTNNDWCDK